MSQLKLAFRTLFRAPFVTVVATISLALGIGANAAIFSLFDETLLRALPVGEPGALVNLAAPGPKPGSQSCNQAGNCEEVFSYPMFRDLERGQQVFTGIAAHRLFAVNLAYKRQTLNGEGLLVSGSYFPVLGLQAALGRLIGPGDDRTLGESPVVVLSHEYWRTRFEQDPNALNETLIINGHPMTIVGVTPAGFTGTTVGSRPQVFVPITMRPQMMPFFAGMDNRRGYWAYLFARLRPGVSIEQARAALNGQYRAILNEVEAPLQKGMSDQTMGRFRTKEVLVEPGARGQSWVHREALRPLSLLLGVTALVLIIACANIANLLLARAATREAEMAVRLSIGASRWQLVRQLLVESVVLAVLGGLLGLIVAGWTLNGIAAILPAEVVATLGLQLNGRVLLFAGALTIVTGLLFGLFPALHSTRPNLAGTLKGRAGQPSGARAAAHFRIGLAVGQIALSMALLVSAGLFAKSLYNVSRVDLGLQLDNVVTFMISPVLNGYEQDRSLALFERVEDALAAVPGVTGVTAAMVPLLAGSSWGNDVAVEGFRSGPDTDANSRYNEIGPGYFRTLGVPLIAGREFTRADAAGAPKTAIVNEQFTKKFGLGRNAVGKRMSNRGSDKLDIEIVGLVPDTKYNDVKEAPPPLFYRPYRQAEQTPQLCFYVRTALPPEQLLAEIPRLMSRLDPDLPVENLVTMPQQVRESVFLDRMISVLSASFAALATLLAAVGLYGVLAYTVTQRTREIGLRMALGAPPARVRVMILRQVAWMTLAGGVIGLLGAVFLGRAARALLFELQGHDPAVFAASAVALVVVALVAGFIPALRASRVDPMLALRYE